MKKTQTGFWALTIVTILAAATLCLYPSFRGSAQTKDSSAAKKPIGNYDTGKSATKHSCNQMGNVDQADLDKAIWQVEQSMKEFKEQDWPKVQIEINNAIKEIDAAGIQRKIELSIKEADIAKVKAEIQQAVAEVQLSLKEIDVDQIKMEVSKAINQVDINAIEKEIANAKKINAEQIKVEMAAAKEQMAKASIDMKAQMDNAAKQIKLAKKQLQLVRDGLDELEKDGLKKKGERVSINYKDDIMYINGTAQSRAISAKYEKYFNNGNNIINNNNNNNGATNLD